MKQKELIFSILDEWNGKTIILPDHLNLFGQRSDSVDYFSSEYKILNYVDSLGCLSCDLRLREWSILLKEFRDRNLSIVPVFIFSSKNKKIIKEIQSVIKQSAISFPIIVDSLDRINKLNNFPSDTRFQTFLLDRKNKVLAVGNPVLNNNIKDFYFKMVKGEVETKDEEEQALTLVKCNQETAFLGTVEYQKEQSAEFVFTNNGSTPFVIQNVTTSCGCVTVSYSKAPLLSGESMTLRVIYKAEHPEYFEKTITVYCNTPNSPIKLCVVGNAK